MLTPVAACHTQSKTLDNMTRSTKAVSADVDNERPVKKRKTARELAAATPRRHTRGMTTDAARKAVLDTPELLENIISFLPPTDILTKVQRLSRQWKDAVESSPIIKNKLWTRFLDATAIQPTEFSNNQLDPMCPHLGKGWVPIYSHAVTLNPALGKGLAGSVTIFLDESMPFLWLRKSNGDMMCPKVVDFVSFEAGSGPDCSVAGHRESWRDMYLTNPPITTAFLCASNHEDPKKEFGPGVIKLFVRDHDGLTLGTLHDTFMVASPSKVRENWGPKKHQFMGSLYVGLA